MSRYIRQQSGSTFEGSWMLVTEWKDITEYQSDIDKVCAKFEFDYLLTFVLNLNLIISYLLHKSYSD